jgi:uncharacterized membrane protein YbhN (UPF0104 family)
MGLGAGFRGRSALAYVQEKLERVPWPALRARAKRWGAGAVAVDTDLARVGAARSANWRVTAAFFACWILESLETTLILWLVGGPLDLSLALGVEGAISLARSLGNLAPAGFGVQEAGYATLLTGAGMAVDSAAAFVLLKRCKEIVWIAAGYALLAALRVSPNLSQPFSGRASNP